MEDKERAMEAYVDRDLAKRFKQRLCKTRYDELMLNGCYMEVNQAEAPEMINWENLKARRKDRVLRIFLTGLCSLLLLLVTCFLIGIAKSYEEVARSFSPEIDCSHISSDDLTAEQALQD